MLAAVGRSRMRCWTGPAPLASFVLGVALVLSVFLISLSYTVEAAGSAGQETPRYGGVLRQWMTQDPPGLDVHIDTRFVVYNRARDLYNTLVRFSEDGSLLEPELLAEMPVASPDGLTYTFQLRRGIRFHDGTEMTARDVEFSFIRILQKQVNSWLIEPVKGAKAVIEGTAQKLAGFEVLDDYRFRVTLEYPYAPFISHLAVPPVSIYPAEAVRRIGDEQWPLRPIGSGPFRFKEWVRGQRLVLERNPDYFERGLPYLDGLEFVVLPDEATGMLEFEAGNFDVSGIPDADFARLQNDPKWAQQIISQSSLNTYYLLFNVKVPPLDDVRVRKAIAMAIDKQALVDFLLEGKAKVAYSFLSPGIPGQQDLPTYEYDPDGARRLLAEAGVSTPVSIDVWQVAGETQLRRNEAIQAMLREIGIDMRIVQVDSASYRQARGRGEIPMIQGNWWADFPDPDNYLYVFFHSSQSRNFSSNYSNPRVDQLLERARVLGDQEQRLELYRQAERIVVLEDAAVVPLWHLVDYAIVQPWVKGYFLHPTGVENALKTVWLAERR